MLSLWYTWTPHKRLQKESKGITIFFKNQVNDATSSKNNEILTKLQMFLAIQGKTKDSHTCLLDFGCTKHMTPHKEWFRNLQPLPFLEDIYLGD